MKALVVVDMQNDYITGSMGTPEARGILGAVKDRIERARAEGDAIYFTRDTHGANYLQTQEGRRNPTLHCQIDTDGWEIADGLFAEGDNLIEKTSFGSVRLAAVLGKILPEEIVLVGCPTDLGVISNALILRSALRDTRITVETSLCAGTTPEAHRTAIEAMRNCQIEIK